MVSQATVVAVVMTVLTIMCHYSVRAEKELKIAEQFVQADKDSITEMMEKLDSIVSDTACHSDAPRRPCLDLVSGHSVLSQLCDRITSLEAQLNKIAFRAPSVQNPEVNYNSKGNSKQQSQIVSLKAEINDLKRSSAFFATRKDKIANFTHEKIQNYQVSVNNGIHFDPVSGVFQAPYQGVCHFALTNQKRCRIQRRILHRGAFLNFFSSWISPEIDLEAFLVVDGVVIANAQDEHQAHIDVLTSLDLGQEVWTDLMTNSIPVDSEVTLSFSGYLIK